MTLKKHEALNAFVKWQTKIDISKNFDAESTGKSRRLAIYNLKTLAKGDAKPLAEIFQTMQKKGYITRAENCGGLGTALIYGEKIKDLYNEMAKRGTK